MIFSIIITIYNTEKYLKRCLNSILSQTFKDYEVICINDGSKDRSNRILNEYKKYSHFKIINQNNVGTGPSRNKAIEISSGEFICFVDSDDTISKDYLHHIYNQIKKQKVMFITLIFYLIIMKLLDIIISHKFFIHVQK